MAMTNTSTLAEAELLARARACDPDRTLCLLFAPPCCRAALLALLLVYHELARAVEVASRPEIGLLRLAFWRDQFARAAAGAAVDHPLVRALTDPLAKGRIALDDLEALITARVEELDDLFASADLGDRSAIVAQLERRLRASSGALARTMARLLRAPEPIAAAAEAAGVAFGLVGTVRAAPFEARRSPRLRTRSLLDMLGFTQGPLGPEGQARVRAAAADVLARAQQKIAETRRLAGRTQRAHLPPLLLATIAEARLRVLDRARFDPFAAEEREVPLLALRLLRAWLARRP